MPSELTAIENEIARIHAAVRDLRRIIEDAFPEPPKGAKERYSELVLVKGGQSAGEAIEAAKTYVRIAA